MATAQGGGGGADFVTAVAQELSRSLRHTAKQQFGLESMSEVHTGILVAIQRVDLYIRVEVPSFRWPGHAGGAPFAVRIVRA